ncbi:hypothetical protein GCM10011497_15150 [Elstera cyanobacteriorum]|uniref:VanZ-like domain-containing protein n=1 Tax=Elstera cyanobacteriorum TaxID=2022747 RepID=A0A255XHZ2_9PROT|nr:VanZ family protein [Elstera cyanobacteriorum]OYQ16603.1 hypothetical protein CHR90_16545 [Elstera cyanobacteriorum]GFZ87181.1 hypothetical protein GCM10011497_15150 [Elstera cyanobacteriorum]
MILFRPAYFLLTALGLAGFMLYGSLAPELAPPGEYGFDKLLHAGAYGTLAGLGLLGTRTRGAAIAVVLLVIAYGGSIEILQSFIPERSGSWGDFTANSLGAIAAGMVVLTWRRRWA